nr:uncharacterized protein LOC131796640 isoform X2 [Pocillopora verrucosa]
MNFPCFAFPLALLVSVQLNTFTWAAMNVTKTSDYDEQGKHLGEQPVRRMLPACNLNTFSLRGGKPTFPEKLGVTRPLCQDKYYATLHDNNLGIARYALYKITAEDAMKPKVPRPLNDPWEPNQTPGILQGSKKLFENQPFQGRYQKGHLVPVKISRYSLESVLATFTYTNCVPQIADFNGGQWKRYELRIEKYARKNCSQEGGTLFLITGTSKVKFLQKHDRHGKIIAAKGMEHLQWFHNNVDVNKNLGPKIAIPNSMWTVGCCLNLNTNQVVGAFGVMGDNSLDKKPLNEFMMSQQNVAYVESALKLEYPNIKLFPNGNDCYEPEKNVRLIKV